MGCNIRRFLALVLAVCLPLGGAWAEGLRVANIHYSDYDLYLEKYPGRQVESDYDSIGERDEMAYLLENPEGWDVARIWTDQCDLAAMDRAGLLMDLSEDSFTSRKVSSMYASIQKAVTHEGHLLGLPTSVFGLGEDIHMGRFTYNCRTQEYVDVAEKLGFTQADYPKTFDDLCTLAVRYMGLPKAARKGTVFHVDGAMGDAKNYFLYMLLAIYTAEYCDEQGHVEYDTPAFRQGLESLESLAQALKAQPRVKYGQKEPVIGLVSQGGAALLNNNPTLNLHVGDTNRIPARLRVLVINANSPRKAEAMDFIACMAEDKQWDRDVKFLDGADYETLAKAMYDAMIADAYVELETQYKPGEQNYAIMQETIAGMLQERANRDYISFYTPEAVAHYAQNVVPYLTFPRIPQMDAYAIAKEYARGRLDADGLIAKLNAIADANVIFDTVQGKGE